MTNTAEGMAPRAVTLARCVPCLCQATGVPFTAEILVSYYRRTEVEVKMQDSQQHGRSGHHGSAQHDEARLTGAVS